MNAAWCCKCKNDVSIAKAVAELPCPYCGSTSYFVVADDGSRETLLGESERMMRIGRWIDAESALSECLSRGLIEKSEYNLSEANIEWRKRCAVSAVKYLQEAYEAVSLPAFRLYLEEKYESYVVDWLLQEYKGIRLVPDGGSYYVEGCEDA